MMQLGRIEIIDRVMYVLRVSEKPTMEDVTSRLKIVLLGMVAMGVIGFFIFLIFKLLNLG
jgi:protein translocase SEC61 complex gamma subunit